MLKIIMRRQLKYGLFLVFCLVALAATFPHPDNPYHEVIEIVASQQNLNVEDLHLQSGHYQNLMMHKTVHLQLLNVTNNQTLAVSAQKWPLMDWHMLDKG